MAVTGKNTLGYLWDKILVLYNKLNGKISDIESSGSTALSEHVAAKNPHNITPELIKAASENHTHGSDDITSLDATKLTGTIDIERLPQGALDRLVKVADDTARFALTTDDIQLGDTVQTLDNKKMYYVIDETKLSTEEGYAPYTADTATAVPWSGVTGKPDSYTPSAHTHTKSEISDFPSALPADGGNADTVNGHTVNADVPEDAKFTDTVVQADWDAVSGDSMIKNKPESFPPSEHNHNDLYYTITAVDDKFKIVYNALTEITSAEIDEICTIPE